MDHASEPQHTPATLLPAAPRPEDPPEAAGVFHAPAAFGGCSLALPLGLPALGPSAVERFATFFTDETRNPNTRAAYARAANDFFAWCGALERPDGRVGLAIAEVRSFHVSGWIEDMRAAGKEPPTIKQKLAGVRKLFDWLVVGQVVPTNPAHAVRGPKHSGTRGKTLVLDAAECARLLDSIPVDCVVGLRDRALIGAMVYTFGRVSAVLGMNVGDYYPHGKRWRVRLNEKGGKRHEMPVHHRLENYLDAYLDAAGIAGDAKSPLFRAGAGRGRGLTERRMGRKAAWAMVRRRAKAAGIAMPIGNHTFRGTGITAYLENGGSLAEAQKMAAHSDPRTTQLYNRTNDAASLDEVERIRL